MKKEIQKGRNKIRKTVLTGAAILFLSICHLFTSCGKKNAPKFAQYYAQGEKLYITHCSNCHQVDGRGLGRLYPPLDTSDFMVNNFNEVICLIRHGKSGEMMVNGKQFNQPMQGISVLSDLEVAEIATYIYNSWTHDHGIVEVKDASKILEGCQSPPD